MNLSPENQSYTFSWPWRWGAHLLSILFHPVFVPVYFMYFLLFQHPNQYLGFDFAHKAVILVQAVAMFTFFPLVTVGLLKALGFIKSIQLHDQKDRIIPLVASGIWYFWIWYVWRNLPDQPVAAIQLALGVWITSVAALMLNTRLKISLHALSLGATLALLLSLSIKESLHYGAWLSIAFIITGAVSSSRLLVSDHRPSEVYWGLLTGALSMLVAGVFA
jgi:hypothetical protein